ncbi:MAG: TIGR03086 family metal-binding protein [Ilumatobacteraceae bacterium]
MADPELVHVHNDAVAVMSSYVDRVADADLGQSTPCAGWDLRQLLEHMVGQHLGFAAVVRAGAATADAYRPRPFSPATWRTSVADMVAAFAGADLDAKVVEVELDPVRPLPISVLLRAQILDTVVHTWDVAAALGEAFTPTGAGLDLVVTMTPSIPDDERRDRPHAAFAHARGGGNTPWELALSALGRDPAWSPAILPA